MYGKIYEIILRLTIKITCWSIGCKMITLYQQKRVEPL